MLSSLAVWYLRKRKKSVLIGYHIKGGFIKTLNKHALTYDNVLFDIDYRSADDRPIILPEGKFTIEREFISKKED
ncbi:hypothetical protein RJD11_10045 [Bacillus velezensis]|uniref:hypothetical protein n=1 Tax=Bacillus TaxID=1386 RepID=UPI001C52BF84|nr:MULTISPECIES: hypothetical protein [Bacillus amyloliquefaciens group]QXP99009.1 hypothetical protein KVY05_09960 [Bacillus velezensis]UHH04837.1 hypothetical protein LUA14_10005 [Bacillus amyloliquefaciens]ULR24564.1 hypothetical protein MJE83_10005 [Bacillus velezensis]UVW11374.1 hypothetical protein NX856_10040 [Bacillus velezensis]WHL78711.1 hypothetical protein QLH34_10025 [Bacillus velezensis]